MPREKNRQRAHASETPPGLPPLLPWSRNTVAALFLVCAACIAVFWSSREGEFLCWDDRGYVSENRELHAISVQEVRDQSTAHVMGNWHPLTMLSYALDLRIAGMDPRWMHTVNVLLHAINTLLLCLLAWRLSGDPWVAVATAFIWALHPYRVEPVAWISGRKELLMTLFGTGALLAYAKHLRAASLPWLAAAWMLFAFAAMCKATVVALAPTLLLLDLYAGRSLRDRTVWFEKAPFLLLAFAIGLVALNAQRDAGAIDEASAFSLGERIILAGANLVRYTATSLIPVGTSNFHPYPDGGQPLPSDLVLFLCVPVIGWLLWRHRSKRPLWFGTLFLAMNLLLVLQVLPVGMALRADRYTYFGGFGIAFTVVMTLSTVLGKAGPRRPLMIAGVYALALGAISWPKVAAWKDCVSFWDDQLARTPDFSIGFTNRAEAHLLNGDLSLALKDMDRAVKLSPLHGALRMNRALVLTRLERYDEALLEYRKGLDVQPAIGHIIQANLGYTLNKMGRYKETDAYCSNSIRIDSTSGIGYRNRGYARFHLGDTAAALADVERALAIMDNDPDALFYLGHIELARGRTQQACTSLQKARSIGINDRGYTLLADSMIAARCR